MQTVRLMLAGLGFVNRGLLRLLIEKGHTIGRIRFKITAIADSSGVALNTAGFDSASILRLKETGGHVSDLPEFSSGLRTSDFAGTGIGDVLVEATPANLVDGNPGLTAARAALMAGAHVVFANKAPLVFAFDELHQLASSASPDSYFQDPGLAAGSGSRIAYSATVCGGLPVVNVIRRDLRGALIQRVRGILNATSNYVLDTLERGGGFQEAVREAQLIGAAEADPSYDINGNDTANKLFIIIKTIGGYTGTYLDTDLTGINRITADQIAEAKSRGCAIRLVATAERKEKSWQLRVAPEEVPELSFLGQCRGWEMGVELESDWYERMWLKNAEREPTGTSAAVLRDILSVCEQD